MAPKFEIATKRVLTLTLTNGDVDSIYSIMRAFQKTDHDDRRLMGFARRFCQRVDQQRTMIASLDEQDRQAALKELLDQYEESQILELTDVVEPGDLLPEGGLHPDLDKSKMDLGLDGGPGERFDGEPVEIDEDLDIQRDLDALGHDDAPPSLPNGRLDLEEIVKNGGEDGSVTR